MGNKEKILELLFQESLTSHEIAQRLDLEESNVRVYLLRLKKANKIRVTDKKGRYKVYTAVKPPDPNILAETQELKYILSQLYTLMTHKFEKKGELKLSKEDLTLLKKIKNVINSEDLLNQINKDKELNKRDLSQENSIEKFLHYGKLCPVCYKENEKPYLLKFYFSTDPRKVKMRNDFMKLFRALEDKKNRNVGTGILCCNCFDKFVEKN